MNIFLDTEFTDFGAAMDLISIGLAADDNGTFYAERRDFDRSLCSDFVRKVVLPQLGKKPHLIMPDNALADALVAWLVPYERHDAVICFDFDGDWNLMTRLLGHRVPAWLTCRNVYRNIDSLLVEQYRMDTGLSDHHALYDAQANRFAYRVQAT